MQTRNINKSCAMCGNPFTPKTIKSLYCSTKCAEAAYRKNRRQKEQEEILNTKALEISAERAFISVPEAIALYGVSKSTLYRLIRNQQISAINLGTRLLRVNRIEIESMFSQRTIEPTPTDENKLYSLEPQDCYSITEITEKFGVSPKTVYDNIRKNSIPTRQIGKYVYAPKSEINLLYTGKL